VIAAAIWAVSVAAVVLLAQAADGATAAPGDPSERTVADSPSQASGGTKGLVMKWKPAVLNAPEAADGTSSAAADAARGTEPADAETAPEGVFGDLSIGADVTFSSKYVWRGLLLTDGPVMQAGATVAWKGLSLNLWGNLDLDDVNGNRGEFNEMDITLDYTHELIGPLSGSVGLVFYDFPNTPFNATTEIYAGLSADVLLQPSLTAYFDIDEADGVYLSLDVGHSFELPDLAENVSAALDLSAGFGWGDADYNRFYFGAASSGFSDFHSSLSLPISLGEYVTVAPSVGYHCVLDDDLRAGVVDDDNIVYGITLSVSF